MRPDDLSLGWRTELIFARFDGEVTERDDHLVIRTPGNPTFWWGNFLLFDHAPRDGELARWRACFDAEIAARHPASRHVTFGIGASVASFELPREFAAAGYTSYASTVLTLRPAQLRAPRKAIDAQHVRIQRLALPAQAPLAVELQVATDEGQHLPVDGPLGYRVFRERQMARYGAMERAGLGHWFGVFTPGGELVADCGLYSDGRLGRFQFVSTHPAWRRRGLCSALVHAVCRHGFDAMALASLVIIADPEDVAIGLYESLGFVRTETHWQIERPPPP